MPHKNLHPPDPFTQEQYQALIMARARGAAPNPLKREELDRFISWCLKTTLQAALINLMLKGQLDVQSTNPDGSPNQIFIHTEQPPPES